MKKSICGANCAQCPSKNQCKGCVETNGCPYGKQCFIAKCILTGGMESYSLFKNGLIDEINGLNIVGMEKVTELYPLVGHFVNLQYSLPSGEKVKFLRDDEIYLGAQVKNILGDEKCCFGVVCRENFLLICRYDEGCTNVELVLYKTRKQSIFKKVATKTAFAHHAV